MTPHRTPAIDPIDAELIASTTECEQLRIDLSIAELWVADRKAKFNESVDRKNAAVGAFAKRQVEAWQKGGAR